MANTTSVARRPTARARPMIDHLRRLMMLQYWRKSIPSPVSQSSSTGIVDLPRFITTPLEKTLLHGDDVTGKHGIGEFNAHRLVFRVAGANHLDLASRRAFREPAAECDGTLDRQFRLIGNAARLLYLAVQEEWPVLGDRYRDCRVAEIGTLEPAGNALFQFGDREALHDQLTEKGVVEPAGVVEPKIHAEIFFTKDLDDDPVARAESVNAVRRLAERGGSRQPQEKHQGRPDPYRPPPFQKWLWMPRHQNVILAPSRAMFSL